MNIGGTNNYDIYMIYNKNRNLVIRDIEFGDITIIYNERLSYGWYSNISVY